MLSQKIKMTLEVKVNDLIFNTSWEYHMMLLWCKFGDFSSNLWWVSLQMDVLPDGQTDGQNQAMTIPLCMKGQWVKIAIYSCWNKKSMHENWVYSFHIFSRWWPETQKRWEYLTELIEFQKKKLTSHNPTRTPWVNSVLLYVEPKVFHVVSLMYDKCSSGICLMYDKCFSGICLMYEPLRT